MAILQHPRYHNFCGERLGKRNIHISTADYENPEYPVDFCPKCKAYMYYHGKDGREGIESVNLHDVECYISNLFMEEKRI